MVIISCPEEYLPDKKIKKILDEINTEDLDEDFVEEMDSEEDDDEI